MSRDLYSNNNDFLKEEIGDSMLHEFKAYKKHKKSKKKRKKKQKKLENKRVREMEKRITKKLEKKYRKKFENPNKGFSAEMYEEFIKRLVWEVISQRNKKSFEIARELNEKNKVIDVSCTEMASKK